MINLKSLLISLAISLGGGALVSFLTRNSMNIYDNIALPSFAPPSIIFPIIWTILYTLMAISAYAIYESNSKIKTKALAIYATQLALNFVWPFLFFNGEMLLSAFLILVVLLVMVLCMITLFYKIKPWAAYLQVPYLVWLIFAAFLNFSIYLLNM